MFSLYPKNQRIYLDYASATPIDDEIFALYIRLLENEFANSSALHKEGVSAHTLLEESREKVAHALGCTKREILFTGNATESNNIAIIGTVLAARKNILFKDFEKLHVIVSSIEHASVLETVKKLEEQGHIFVEYVPVDSNGVIDIVAFKKMIRMETVFVSVMMVNNEIGTIEPIHDIAKIIRHARKHNRATLGYPVFHTDASQALNLIDINLGTLGVDMMTVSSAKVYGPKGVGVLYKKNSCNIDPIMYGGGQEYGLRSGTENIPAIIAFSCALEKAQFLVTEEYQRISTLHTYLKQKLISSIPNSIIHGGEHTIPGIMSFTIPHIESDMLVLYLDSQGFAVSSKSACHNEDAQLSHVLLAVYGDKAKDIGGTVRVSIGRYTTKKDIEKFVTAIHTITTLLLQK